MRSVENIYNFDIPYNKCSRHFKLIYIVFSILCTHTHMCSRHFAFINICAQAVPAAIPDANVFTYARHIIEFAPKVKGVKDVASNKTLFWNIVKATTHHEFVRYKTLP